MTKTNKIIKILSESGSYGESGWNGIGYFSLFELLKVKNTPKHISKELRPIAKKILKALQ